MVRERITNLEALAPILANPLVTTRDYRGLHRLHASRSMSHLFLSFQSNAPGS